MLRERLEIATALVSDGLLFVDHQRATETRDQVDDVAAVYLQMPGSVVGCGDGIDKRVGQDSLQDGNTGYVTTEG
jgi:hypothetical protein